MKKRLLLFITCATLAIAISSCEKEYSECAAQPSVSAITVDVEQLEDELLGVKSKAALRAFLKEHPVVHQFFLNSSQYPNDSIMVETLFNKYQNPYIDSLQIEVKGVFGDLSGLRADLNEAFSHLKYYYPDAVLPRIQTIATGLDNDMYISDSLIIIGLDYYLGEGSKFRPLGLYEYMLKRYTPKYIVPSIMLLYGINGQYNRTDLRDKTMLADMISYGKSFYFAKQMMPCVPDSLFIWYTAEEMRGVRDHEKIIWANLVENELLYETNHMIKKKYIDERPKTPEIGDKAPGRIATWVGWQIVRQYMRGHRDVTLRELMAMKDAAALFAGARYKPSN